MPESKYLAYGFVGFSLSQLLGLLFSGFQLYQPAIILGILITIVLIPGFLHWGGMQNKTAIKLSHQQVLSCFIPSFIACGILIIGFGIGVLVGF